MEKKRIQEIGEMLSQVDALWLNEVGVSGYTAFTWCDCSEIVIKNGERYFRLISHPVGEDGFFTVEEVSQSETERFSCEVDVAEGFRFGRLFFECGPEAPDGIYFQAENAEIFVHALEHCFAFSKHTLKEDTDKTAGSLMEKYRVARRLSKRFFCYEKCVCCGHVLSVRQFSPEKKCPYCGEFPVCVDIKEVHVVFCREYEDFLFLRDEEVLRALKREDRKYHIGVDYLRLVLPYELCIGNIADPPFSNAIAYAHRHSVPYMVEDQLEKLDLASSKASIYLWIVEDTANELMNLWYFSSVFERFENVFLVRRETGGGAVEALEAKTGLTKQDLRHMRDRFDEIKGWNAECLVGDSRGVAPCTMRRMADLVLEGISKRYAPIGEILDCARETFRKNGLGTVRYQTVREVVYYLLKTGEIKSDRPIFWWGFDGNALSHCKYRRASARKKKEPAVLVVSAVFSAFEYGETLSLYRMMDDSSVLYSEQDGRTVVGRDGIVDYIEIHGVGRDFEGKEVFCDLVNSGMLDGEGADLSVLVRYEKDGDSEALLVKVWESASIVQRMEIGKAKEARDFSVAEQAEE